MSTGSPEVVAFGEALIDFKGDGPLRFQGFVGGSPLNVTVAVARLGVPVALASRVSTDLFGGHIVEHLERNGVSLDLLERGDEPSTLAFVQIEDGSARYAFRNLGAADTRYAPDPDGALPTSARALHLGSIGLLFEPAASAIVNRVAANRESCLVHLDPNVRPSLIPDRAAYLERLSGWLGFTHWLKLSREDLEWLHPDRPEADVAGEWLRSGPSVVVVTDGPSGARLYRTARPVLAVPAPSVTVVDTIGAGDTFSGATLAALLELGLTGPAELEGTTDETLSRVLLFAVGAAAINCTRPGCDPPTRAELGPV